eukprot:89851_1
MFHRKTKETNIKRKLLQSLWLNITHITNTKQLQLFIGIAICFVLICFLSYNIEHNQDINKESHPNQYHFKTNVVQSSKRSLGSRGHLSSQNINHYITQMCILQIIFPCNFL